MVAGIVAEIQGVPPVVLVIKGATALVAPILPDQRRVQVINATIEVGYDNPFASDTVLRPDLISVNSLDVRSNFVRILITSCTLLVRGQWGGGEE